jgi:hypothetical protein
MRYHSGTTSVDSREKSPSPASWRRESLKVRAKSFVDRGTSPIILFQTENRRQSAEVTNSTTPAVPLTARGQKRREKVKERLRAALQNPDLSRSNFRAKAFAKGTVYRQDMMIDFSADLTATQLINTLNTVYTNPNSRFTYAATIQGQRKDLAKSKEWRDGMRAMRIEKGKHVTKRYTPLTVKLITDHVLNAPSNCKASATIALAWTTVSRHADVRKMIIHAKKEIHGIMIVFCTVYGTKTDIFNEKNFVQAFAIPPKFSSTILSMLPEADKDGNVVEDSTKVALSTLPQVQKALLKIEPSLVARSMRIGASQALRMNGLSMKDIALSTFHGMERDTGSLFTYLQGCWWVDEGLSTQILNSVVLLKEARFIDQGTLELLKKSELKSIFLAPSAFAKLE